MKSVRNQFLRYSVTSCQIEAGTVPSLVICQHDRTLLDRQMINKPYGPFVLRESPFVLLERRTEKMEWWNGHPRTRLRNYTHNDQE